MNESGVVEEPESFTGKAKSIQMNLVTITLILMLICFYTSSEDSISRKGKLKAKVNMEQTPITKSVPLDSTPYSIQITGPLNTVNINNELQTATAPHKADASYTITVNGEGNSVTINKEDKKGKVNISQNGNGNKVNVTQSKSQK